MPWYPKSRRAHRRRFPVALALLSAATLAAGACGDGDDATGGNGGEVATEPVVEAHDLAFAPDRVTVPVGEQVTLTFENHDDGVAHSLRVDAPGDPATEVFAGPDERELDLRLEAGEYTFRCDVHSQMTGTLVAAP